MKEIPTLFEKKEDCCGCGACLNICPRQAISMQEDECGFIYPVIDEDKCIRCGQCKRVCAFQNAEETNSPIECYAAVSMDKEQAQKSASAGIFAAIATQVIHNGGIVYGAAFDDNWNVHHIAVECPNQLIALQGSKYAHSDIGRIFSNVIDVLKTGRLVLFSGTPCQVAGLKGFLGKEYSNLLTVDIVCHGVPSNQMLQDYLHYLGEEHHGHVSEFTFRDKSIGWGINGSFKVNGKKMRLWQSASSYMYYFTKGWLYRENCYKCKYACNRRPADITIGDFWGIEKQHPEFLGDSGWNEREGISCVVVNTSKGLKIINEANLDLRNSTFNKIAAGNDQLNKASDIGQREVLLPIYREFGWKGIERLFLQQVGIKKYSSVIKALVPTRIKRMIKGKM